MISKKALVSAIALTGVALVGFGQAHSAIADPVSNSYSIVGSDTLEDVVNALANGTDITGTRVRVTAGGLTLGSFDATGSPYIQTKPGGKLFTRPNGSGDGLKAVSASNGDTTRTFVAGKQGNQVVEATLTPVTIGGLVDIARSSSTPTSDGTGGLYAHPFGRDAIAVAVSSAVASFLDANGGRYITQDELASIYSNCSTTSLTLSRTVAGTTNTIVVEPVIPQSGSGTRKDFIKKITNSAVTDGTISSSYLNNSSTFGAGAAGGSTLAIGSGSTAGTGCIYVGQEHDATSAAFNPANHPNAIMPMSASRWIAMSNGASLNKSGAAQLVQIATTATPYVSTSDVNFPVNSLNGKLVPGSGYYADGVWGRDVWLITSYSKLTSDTVFGSLFTGNVTNKLTNTETNSISRVGLVKKLYGFLAPVATTGFRVAYSY